MKRLLTLTLVLAAASWCPAQGGKTIPPKALDHTTADESNPLPRYLTPAERLLPIDKPTWEHFRSRTPPAGVVRCPAEYELQEGLFIAWEGYTNILTAMTVSITTLDPEAVVYVVVDSASEQTSASSTLASAGADMDQVEFIIRTTDSVWIRDYGPRFIFEDGNRAIIDHTYNRPRPNDNLLNDYISTLWAEPHYDIPLTHGGGNFHLFSNGDAFMSSLILAENPGLSEQDVVDLYQEYQNLNLTIYTGFPTSFDSTRHIDMWMMPLGDDKIVIGEYDITTGQPYTITENAVTDLTARGYTVYRTPGWNSGGTHYTYTNAVIINDQVFISYFGGSYASEDIQARTVFQTALPDHTVIPVNSASIIHSAGAIHCIVMHVPNTAFGLSVTPAGGLVSSGNVGGPFAPDSIVYTLENSSENPFDYSVSNTQAWVTLLNAAGTIPAYGTTDVTVSINSAADALAAAVYTDTIQFTNTTDHVGDTTRVVSLTVGVPELIYGFNMDTDPGWTTEGLWEWGQPTGGGGSNGGPDPTSGYTGDNVQGYNLDGDYPNSMPQQHLTTGAMDCTGLMDTRLSFRRWLGVEAVFDHAYLAISTNASTWTTLWQSSAEIADSAWTYQEFDVASIADGQPTVYLRWTMGTSDSSKHYCGWNIDDVEIWAVDLVPAGQITGARSCLDHGPAGQLCLELDQGEVEPRMDGVQMLEFDVTESAAAVGAAVNCANSTYTGSVQATGNGLTVTVTFDPALPDGDCCTVSLTGDIEDTFAVRTLSGDIDQNGIVATTDAGIIKPNFGVTPTDAECIYDHDCNGTVATTDFGLVKPLFGSAAPNCP